MEGSKALRLAAGLIALVAIGLAWNASREDGGGTDDPAAPAQARPKGPVVTVTVAYSPEKEKVFTRAFSRFNDRKVKVDGKRVFVEGQVVSSGASHDALKDGSLKPVIWSPSSSLWGRLLTHTADVPWVPEKNPSFARTPLVIAMWEAQAKALGWPKRALGWSDVVAEATSGKGWGAHGHPEWGPFRLGQTNPDFSTSGLSAVSTQYYFATGKTEGVTLKELEQPEVRAKVRAIQSSVVHYGDTTLFFAEQLAQQGPAYASAVAMEETTLVDFNRNLRQDGSPKLVALYPKEGTFFSDNPLIVLDAPWVSKAQKQAAGKLVDYLTSEGVQKGVDDLGFRPGDDDLPAKGQLTKANGVDVDEPKRRLTLPSPAVLSRIRELWREDRKPADVAVVLDTSGSMLEENRLIEAQRGLATFVALLGPRDRAALVTFADAPKRVLPLAEMSGTEKTRLRGTVAGLFAEGGTSVYDATLNGVELLRETGDPEHIRAVVVLTDGLDNRSTTDLEGLIEQLEPDESGSPHDVRVFTIAYGADASLTDMQRIAEAGGGKPYEGDPENIKQVYTSISSFF